MEQIIIQVINSKEELLKRIENKEHSEWQLFLSLDYYKNSISKRAYHDKEVLTKLYENYSSSDLLKGFILKTNFDFYLENCLDKETSQTIIKEIIDLKKIQLFTNDYNTKEIFYNEFIKEIKQKTKLRIKKLEKLEIINLINETLESFNKSLELLIRISDVIIKNEINTDNIKYSIAIEEKLNLGKTILRAIEISKSLVNQLENSFEDLYITLNQTIEENIEKIKITLANETELEKAKSGLNHLINILENSEDEIKLLEAKKMAKNFKKLKLNSLLLNINKIGKNSTEFKIEILLENIKNLYLYIVKDNKIEELYIKWKLSEQTFFSSHGENKYIDKERALEVCFKIQKRIIEILDFINDYKSEELKKVA